MGTVRKIATKTFIVKNLCRTEVTVESTNNGTERIEIPFEWTLPENSVIFAVSRKIETEDAEDVTAIVEDKTGESVMGSRKIHLEMEVHPRQTLTISLEYKNVLRLGQGVYKHWTRIPTNPVNQDMRAEITLESSSEIRLLHVPSPQPHNGFRYNQELLFRRQADTGNMELRQEDSWERRKAVVSWAPSQEEQAKMSSEIKECTVDLVILFDFNRNDEETQLEHNENGFVYYLAPNLPPMPMKILLAVDTETTMLPVVKTALKTFLETLIHWDSLNMIFFSNNKARAWNRKGLQEAIPSNVKSALTYLEDVRKGPPSLFGRLSGKDKEVELDTMASLIDRWLRPPAQVVSHSQSIIMVVAGWTEESPGSKTLLKHALTAKNITIHSITTGKDEFLMMTPQFHPGKGNCLNLDSVVTDKGFAMEQFLLHTTAAVVSDVEIRQPHSAELINGSALLANSPPSPRILVGNEILIAGTCPAESSLGTLGAVEGKAYPGPYVKQIGLSECSDSENSESQRTSRNTFNQDIYERTNFIFQVNEYFGKLQTGREKKRNPEKHQKEALILSPPKITVLRHHTPKEIHDKWMELNGKGSAKTLLNLLMEMGPRKAAQAGFSMLCQPGYMTQNELEAAVFRIVGSDPGAATEMDLIVLIIAGIVKYWPYTIAKFEQIWIPLITQKDFSMNQGHMLSLSVNGSNWRSPDAVNVDFFWPIPVQSALEALRYIAEIRDLSQCAVPCPQLFQILQTDISTPQALKTDWLGKFAVEFSRVDGILIEDEEFNKEYVKSRQDLMKEDTGQSA